MNKTALRHAWERLHEARSAVEALKRSKSFADSERAWSKFIAASSTVYSKLEKGSKGNVKCEPWFGRVKHERKKDQLLRYVHHARNADEHGITDITKRSGARLVLQGTLRHGAPPSASVANGERALWLTNIRGTKPDGAIDFTPAQVRLVTVFDDLHGDAFDVPTEHLGAVLKSKDDPIEVASLALQYLDRIVRDGSEFAK